MENENTTTENEAKGNAAGRKKISRKKKILIIVICAIVAAVVIFFCTRKALDESKSAEFETGQEKPDTDVQEGSVTAGIQIPGYKSITIESGTKDVTVELTNPEENNVYFEISFYLPETDETIYTSKLIKPGDSVYEITLEHAMDPGEYDMTLIYNTYSADEEMSPRNGAQVNTTLIVK